MVLLKKQNKNWQEKQLPKKQRNWRYWRLLKWVIMNSFIRENLYNGYLLLPLCVFVLIYREGVAINQVVQNFICFFLKIICFTFSIYVVYLLWYNFIIPIFIFVDRNIVWKTNICMLFNQVFIVNSKCILKSSKQ